MDYREQGNSKSTIDYIIIRNEYTEQVINIMTIDNEKDLAIYRKEKERVVYSDHHSIICKINWLEEYTKQKKEKKCIMTSEGYSKYRNNMQRKTISKIWELKNKPLEEKYTEWINALKQEIINLRCVTARPPKPPFASLTISNNIQKFCNMGSQSISRMDTEKRCGMKKNIMTSS